MADSRIPTGAGVPSDSPGTCQVCEMDPRFTHSSNEHGVAVQLRAPLLQHVRDDALLGLDSPLTYAEVVLKFGLSTTVRRVGRVLDAVECQLVAEGWPRTAAAGVTAYVVSKREGRPSYGWDELWGLDPRDARAEAREYVRERVLTD